MFPPSVSTLDSIFNFPPGPKASVFGGAHPIGAFECGLCTDGTSCVCREMVLNYSYHSIQDRNYSASGSPWCPSHCLPPPIDAHSILDNLPPYQPPVPLRRRPEVRPLRSLFPVVPLSGSSSQVTQTSPVGCSGDPSNCLACADDVFGQAFCAAVWRVLGCRRPVC
jgi:hypothetical protein